jgi:outer membrane protein assembly factor BamB
MDNTIARLCLGGLALTLSVLAIAEGSSGLSQVTQPAPGTLQWRFQAGGPLSSAPALGADGTIYFLPWDSYLYALNPDGTLKWRFYHTEVFMISSSPTIGADGTIYFGSDYFYAVNPDGTLKWSFKDVVTVVSAPAHRS